MPSAGRMTEQVQVFRKATTGTSPEAWIGVSGWRRASISRLSDRAALEESAQYDLNVTHHAKVDAADIYEPQGHGARLLRRRSDGQNYFIVRAVGVGRRGRTGKLRYMRLSLTAFTPAEVE